MSHAAFFSKSSGCWCTMWLCHFDSSCSSCGRPIIHALRLLGKVRLLVAWLKLLDALPAQTKDRSTVPDMGMSQTCPKNVPQKSGYPATNWFAYCLLEIDFSGRGYNFATCFGERFPHVLVRKRWLFARHEFCLVQRHVHSVTRVITIKSIAGIAGLRLKQLFFNHSSRVCSIGSRLRKSVLVFFILSSTKIN